MCRLAQNHTGSREHHPPIREVRIRTSMSQRFDPKPKLTMPHSGEHLMIDRYGGAEHEKRRRPYHRHVVKWSERPITASWFDVRLWRWPAPEISGPENNSWELRRQVSVALVDCSIIMKTKIRSSFMWQFFARSLQGIFLGTWLLVVQPCAGASGAWTATGSLGTTRSEGHTAAGSGRQQAASAHRVWNTGLRCCPLARS